MKNIKEQLVKLINVRSIITIILVSTAVVQFIRSQGVVSEDTFKTLLMMVVAFYFTKEIAKERQGG